jgi:hypothetical protein
VEVVNFINAMHNNVILSEARTPCQLEVGVIFGFHELKHFYLPIYLEVPGKEEEPLACSVIEHELDVVFFVDGEELSDDAGLPEL